MSAEDSRLQLMWAALATVFIIWDMVTIPPLGWPSKDNMSEDGQGIEHSGGG